MNETMLSLIPNENQQTEWSTHILNYSPGRNQQERIVCRTTTNAERGVLVRPTFKTEVSHFELDLEYLMDASVPSITFFLNDLYSIVHLMKACISSGASPSVAIDSVFVRWVEEALVSPSKYEQHIVKNLIDKYGFPDSKFVSRFEEFSEGLDYDIQPFSLFNFVFDYQFKTCSKITQPKLS